MDFNMPNMNGVEAVRAIMEQQPTPVLMFSAHTRQGARETFDALHAGAIDFVTKPAGEVSSQLDGIADELCRKLVAASRSRLPRAPTTRAPSLRFMRPITEPSLRRSQTMSAVNPNPRVIFIAVSTGGPVALSRVIPRLPASLRAAVVIVQHMPATFTGALADRLNSESQLEVREARDGDIPCPGLVLIAPGGKHLKVDLNGTLRLADGPPVHGCKPAADFTMKGAAAAYGRRAVGLVMTGMGKDGAEGLRAIKQAGGKTLAQDKESSLIFGMPKAALELDAVDEVVALDGIADKLSHL
jgi:two-component system chemotaxis response regulator CheB